MTIARLPLAALLLLAATARLLAGTVDGHEWPPDPSRYAAPGTPVAPGLAIGDVLSAKNASLAKDLLPSEVLKHYQNGEYENPIVSWPEGIIHHDRSFEEATAANPGKYVLDAKSGTILDKATGAMPDYIYGTPFPTIDASDSEAGLKALWNQLHNYWNTGSYNFNALIVWVAPKGVDRQSLQDVYAQYYENQNPTHREPNPQNFSWQLLSNAKTPADLQGTAALSNRHRDPSKRDSVWTYVPALRRVRAVSPANRSDGFLGSDLSQDDGNFFDGKPEDFEWRTVGLRDGVRIVDPESIRGNGGPLRWVETGGWRQDWPLGLPAAGFEKKGWTGIGWAPVSAALAKRKFWVVEGVPRDKYYLFGKIELWIDAESWTGAFNRKFSWKGELLNTYQVTGYLNHPTQNPKTNETEWFWSSQFAWQCAENLTANRATLAGLRSDMALPFDRRVHHPIERLFDVQTLNRFGK
jgi:Protein of unknown function (DUF1329)